MDFRRPVEAVIPGVQGRLLAVLGSATGDMNMRTIARLAGVSAAQASRVLPELVALGLVERREAPPSALFALVPENVAARLVRSLIQSREIALEDLGALASRIDPTPVSAVVYGSLARGDGDALSDIDVVLVRRSDVGEDDEPWASSAEQWRSAARRVTGNPVHVIEIDETEVSRRLRRPTPLWRNVLREGVVIYGSALDSIPRRRRNA